MGFDDMLKDQIREYAPELKQRLVQEFNELTSKDMDETGDDPDEIVDKIQKKTGQPRSQVEKRVTHVAKQTGAGAPKHSNSPKQKQKQTQTTGASGSNKR